MQLLLKMVEAFHCTIISVLLRVHEFFRDAQRSKANHLLLESLCLNWISCYFLSTFVMLQHDAGHPRQFLTTLLFLILTLATLLEEPLELGRECLLLILRLRILLYLGLILWNFNVCEANKLLLNTTQLGHGTSLQEDLALLGQSRLVLPCARLVVFRVPVRRRIEVARLDTILVLVLFLGRCIQLPC